MTGPMDTGNVDASSEPFQEGDERKAFVELDPQGFHIRNPPSPHELNDYLTDDDSLFQTIHMGGAVVDESKYSLLITGLVSNPFSLTLSQLKQLPSKTVTSFHECYGSPLVPPTKALRRIGNITWTGVPLHILLSRAQIHPEAQYIWSEGLDRGTFAKVSADRYQKDLPISKALADEVLVAYAMNDCPLSKNRGGPVRLVVPGWFGTNSTKWLCRIEAQDRRASGPFTTTFYNEHFPPDDPTNPSKPVWKVQPNSMITRPVPESTISDSEVVVEGWAWSEDSVQAVEIGVDIENTSTVERRQWVPASVEGRTEFSWQRFRGRVKLGKGAHVLLARATGMDGRTQPLGEGRNHVHRVQLTIE